MKGRNFSPTEIIFAATNACNLHCEHCFIERNPHKLEIKDAVSLIESCVNAGSQIDRIGFSGGEPFLYMDFLVEVTKAAISHDLMFDQIMTNGDWWQDEADLCKKLQALYDGGYDGKIGLSWDSYHGQSTERMETFIRTVQKIFGKDSVNIQTVDDTEGESLPLARTSLLATPSAGDTPTTPPADIPVYTLPRTYTSDDSRAWQARRWFREDYCEGPGQILYVHADGNIAPCCGFANENPALFIGYITDSFEKIMKKAAANPMIKLCYEEGLSHYRRHGIKKLLHSQGKKLPGKCSDICSFCDYVCKINKISSPELSPQS
ncbi:4Fe-4S single cluster domain-containing protein [Treponema bryantii]|uniref:4Fe-4S single cluster domain-containing protein n=1 Tax=Treponema bryantii TaxID=163 RepID=A0A1H9JUT8_9SPIR|nr:radical SAM protein [Treponema bryantii]SEQ90588.1 4Fe-4S single cluster domain-containing protein [Treponema bryantii]